MLHHENKPRFTSFWTLQKLSTTSDATSMSLQLDKVSCSLHTTFQHPITELFVQRLHSSKLWGSLIVIQFRFLFKFTSINWRHLMGLAFNLQFCSILKLPINAEQNLHQTRYHSNFASVLILAYKHKTACP